MPIDPKCLDDVVAFGKIGEGTVVASVCGFDIKLPDIPIPPISLNLPGIGDLLPQLPIPKISFVLSCDPNKPIDITAGIAYGGGRIPCYLPDPDNEENEAAA